MARVRLETKEILDWKSFHEVCKATFGFPDFYGENMNAWIDCMSSLDDTGMTRFDLSDGQTLTVEIAQTEEFKGRVPEIFDALLEDMAFVNQRYIEGGSSIRVALILL